MAVKRFLTLTPGVVMESMGLVVKVVQVFWGMLYFQQSCHKHMKNIIANCLGMFYRCNFKSRSSQ